MPNADRKSGQPRKTAQPAAKSGKGAAKSTGLRADGTPRRASHHDKPAPRRAAPARGDARRDADFEDRGTTTGRGTAAGRATTTGRGTTAGRSTTTGRVGATPARTTTSRTTTSRTTTTGTGRPSAGTPRLSSAGRAGDVWNSPRTASSTRGAGKATTKAKAPTKAKPKTADKAPRPLAEAAPRRVRPPSATIPVRKPTNRPDAETTPGERERLQKVLAQAGIGSRRASEELIAAGRVTVDGQRAELGDRVDPVNSVIHVDGERIVTDDRKVYLAMNKPAGVVSTMADEKGRAALADFLGNMPQRVYHVGRLDADSEGLLLLTNDGTLAHRLMHPSYNVPKTYLAEVPGPVRAGLRKQLMEGVELEDGPVAVDSFRTVDAVGGRVLVELVLHEGRKHVVRRLLAEVGHPVTRLVRTAIGPIKIGDLKSGRTRRLTPGEIAALFKVVGD